MSSYYIAKPDGARMGPYELSVVKSMVNDGSLEPNCLVWTQGWPEWRTLDSIIAPVEAPEGMPRVPSVKPEPTVVPSSDACEEQHAHQSTSSAADAEGGSVQYNPISAFRSVVFARYATFKGRASRSEYWWYVLAFYLLAIPLSFVGLTGGLILALGLPSLALSVRRAHDTGYSGWFILVPIFNVVLCFLPSAPPNKWGEGPEPPVK